MCNVPSIQLTKHNSSLSKLNQVWAARFYKSRCSLMQPACVHHFGSNHFVITMKNCAKTILPFQSILELENQLAHDAFNELIASNSCNYCLKVAAHFVGQTISFQYSWRSIISHFPNHIKFEQLNSISRDVLQCSQLASAIFGATI